MKIGSDNISKIYLGSEEIGKIYLGNEIIYEASTGPIYNINIVRKEINKYEPIFSYR